MQWAPRLFHATRCLQKEANGKYISTLLLAIILSGCDLAKELQEMGEKQAKVQSLTKDRYGWQTQVAWNIHNGILTLVTIIFRADDVRGETAARLEDATRLAVSESFHLKPRNIYIQIATTAEQ